MNPTSDKMANLSNRSTETKRTDETTREQHLSRLDDVVRTLRKQGNSLLLFGNRREAKRLREQVESVRWAIERE